MNPEAQSPKLADSVPAVSRQEEMDAERVHQILDALPERIRARIAGHSVLRHLTEGEASKIQLIVANYRETHEILSAALDLETLLRIGPQRLAAGVLKEAQWDEGIRRLRQKIRELGEVVAQCGEAWRVVLTSLEALRRQSRAA